VNTVYRTKAEVPPDPPHVRILSTLYRLRRMGRERDDAPPCSVPIWSQLEADSGPPSPQGPARRRPRAHPGWAVVTAIVVGCALVFAIVGYRKKLHRAHTSEAVAIIQGVRAAEEVHRAETLGYLGCGRCEGAECEPVQGSLLARYPREVPGDGSWSWSQPAHPDYACWQQLAVITDGPVRYTYAVVAGPPGVSPPPIPGLAHQPAWPTPMEPWYVVQAIGDLDGDGVPSIAIGSSFSPAVYVENEGE
jgi:type IV pilus assembly protein PilA